MPDPDSHGTDFAYVAGSGTPPRPDPAVAPFDLVMEAVAILLDQVRRPPYRCRVVSVFGGAVTQHDVVVRPLTGSYVCTDLATGRVDSSDGVSRVRLVGGEPEEIAAHQVPSVPLPARLAFPERLPVWGRSGEHRMTGAVRLGDEIVVELASTGDPHLRGSLTVDTRRRLATRLDLVGDVLRSEDLGADGWVR
ncbi:hypothetical protein [Clavibacter sp. MX14-G9D]|uniref:hypothetical protein n=1 Tax=Clavibacter sp. MX14-G9D TaxID=3064656 RepID=UPI00293EBBAB|nr:hypothetical protein [Clavibacter sp. MX14-G9D]